MSELEFFTRHGFDNLHTFRRAELILSAYGFTNSTWRNDLCPSLSREAPGGEVWRLWIDWRDPAGREGEDMPLAAVTVETDAGEVREYVPFASVAYAIRDLRRNFARESVQ